MEIRTSLAVTVVMVEVGLLGAMEVFGRILGWIADNSGSDGRHTSDGGVVRLFVDSVDVGFIAAEDVVEVVRCDVGFVIAFFFHRRPIMDCLFGGSDLSSTLIPGY